MFVSPPPTSTTQLLPGLLSRKKSSELATISESGDSSHMSIYSDSLGRKDFVNAPPEFADRARDEIKKRLLKKRTTGSRRPSVGSTGGLTSLHSFRGSSSYGGESQSDVISLATNSTGAQSSLFSSPSLQTNFTNYTQESTSFHQDSKPLVLTLEQALPSMFYDMYSPDILMNPQNLLGNGRPKFTKRELMDWDLNDIRSLLIVERLKPEWHGQLPRIDFSTMQNVNGPDSKVLEFRFILLPLDSSDDVIIDTLVNSDLYTEANLGYEFKMSSAQYTVNSARQRHEQLLGYHEPVMHLSKPEWRNIIENYLLNIAVEAQCRFDFKKACSEYKKWKLEQVQTEFLEQQRQTSITKPNMPPPSIIPKKSKNSLLKRALLRSSQLKIGERMEEQNSQGQENDLVNAGSENSDLPTKVSLSKEEKAMVWSHCQLQVYQRLGLDWTPDNVPTNPL